MSSCRRFLPKGSPVELTYQYNANQVLEVAVAAAGNTAKVSIERNTGLAPSEISKAATGIGVDAESRRDDQVRNLISHSITRRSAKVGWMEPV